MAGGLAVASFPVFAESKPFGSIKPGRSDVLALADGFRFDVLVKCGDIINKAGERFGDCNDFIWFFPDNSGNSGVLWVNHEYVLTQFISGWTGKGTRTREQVDRERQAVGGSLLRIHRGPADGKWTFDLESPLSRRLDATTPIPIIASRAIMGGMTAVGTLGGCAGGYTPWGSVLSCEENYHHYYGEVVFDPKTGARQWDKSSEYGWAEFYEQPPEHFGWVVEINPISGAAKKLTALGRFAHEGATVTTAKDGRAVVYMGDDARDQCIYKFVSEKPGSLEQGILYVANLEESKWVPLVLSHPKLKSRFTDQLDLLIRTREAAALVGGSPCDRPEDIEIDPQTGAVIVALTNNESRGNLHGSLLRILERDGDPLALEFSHSTFLAGGPGKGFSCPDNLAFDRRGNLWITSDISASRIGHGAHAEFGNNGLFWIPMSGPQAGKVFQVAHAPIDAEFTGPCFSPDGRTLFLSVQHPGESSKSADQPTSRWPNGGSDIPRSSVVAISGPSLDRLTQQG